MSGDRTASASTVLSHARHPFHPRQSPRRSTRASRSRGLEPLSGAADRPRRPRKAAISALQAATERRNALSKEIGQAKAQKDEARAQELMAEVAAPEGSRAASSKQEERAAEKALRRSARRPSRTCRKDDVPVGADEHGNVERHRVGNAARTSRREAAFRDRRGARPDGFRDAPPSCRARASSVLKGGLARLERALGQFMIDLHTNEHGYTEVCPPLLVRDEAHVRHGATAEVRRRPVLRAASRRAAAG